MSVKAFARELGVSPRAVRRAASDGRLTEASIGRDRRGHLVIRDATVAFREWEVHTRPRVACTQPSGSREVDVDDPALPLAIAQSELVDLVVKIEKRLTAVFHEAVRLLPATTPATRWQALCAAWDEIPAALEKLHREVMAAVPAIRRHQEAFRG